MDKFNTHHVTMGIKKSMKQQNSKQKRHIAPKSKEFRSWILRKVIDNGKNNSLNIWILDDPKIWGTHLNRREVVMRTMDKSVLPYLKEAITSCEIGKQSFGYTGFTFFAHEYLCQIWKK